MRDIVFYCKREVVLLVTTETYAATEEMSSVATEDISSVAPPPQTLPFPLKARNEVPWLPPVFWGAQKRSDQA